MEETKEQIRARWRKEDAARNGDKSRIVRVDQSKRICFIESPDGETFFASFQSFLDLPTGHTTCVIRPGAYVEFKPSEKGTPHRIAQQIRLLDQPDFPTERVLARVSEWKTEQAYGFVAIDGCQKCTVFLHKNDVRTCNEYLHLLRPGRLVEIDLAMTDRGPKATNVDLIQMEEDSNVVQIL